MKRCFEAVGFTQNEIFAINKFIAAILLLGNVSFRLENEGAKISDMTVINYISDLLECEQMCIVKALTLNIKSVIGNDYKNKLNIKDAEKYRDTFAKEMYNRLFLWIIKKLNFFLGAKNENDKEYIKSIGLLDIFGFESLDINSLEQLCINYANEKLQQLYNQDLFQSMKDDLLSEGLDKISNNIKYQDNKPIIDLIEHSIQGIFQKLNDCTFQNKDAEYFIEMLKKDFKNNKYLIISKIKDDINIKIRHSTKDIIYNCLDFTEKNKEELKYTMVQIMISSKSKIMKMIFFNTLDKNETETISNELEKSLKIVTSKYMTDKFKADIQSLINELTNCNCTYIKCLNPNEKKSPYYIKPNYLFNQIQYYGILDNIYLRKTSYPKQITYDKFINENKYLLNEIPNINEEKNNRLKTEKIIYYLLLNNTNNLNKNENNQYLLGKNKLFMKEEFENTLRTKINKIKKDYTQTIDKCIYKIQFLYNLNKNKIKRQKSIKNIELIQSLVLKKKTMNEFNYKINYIINIQKLFRTYLAMQNNNKNLFNIKCLSIKLNIQLNKLREEQKNEIRIIAKQILNKAIDKMIYIYYSKINKKIQPFIKKFLVQKKYRKIIKKALRLNELYSKQKVIKRLQMQEFLYKIYILKSKNNFLYMNMVTHMSSKYFYKLRCNIEVIQNYFYRYKYKKEALININEFYFEKERKNETLNINKLDSDVFPFVRFIKESTINDRNDNKLNNIKLCSNMSNFLRTNESYQNSKIFDTTESYEKKNLKQNLSNCLIKLENGSVLQNGNFIYVKDINQYAKELSLPDNSIYKDAKIRVFARILSIDILSDINEVYDTNWGDEFRSVYEINMDNDTPIQLIYLGDTNTVLINSSGKIFTFGWNENSQCGIPINLSTTREYSLPMLNRNNSKQELPSIPTLYYTNALNLSNIYNIYCNYASIYNDSVYVITDKNECYSFGKNENNQLALGSPFPFTTPHKIYSIKDKIKEVKATQDFFITINTDDESMLWFCPNKTTQEQIIKNREVFSKEDIKNIPNELNNIEVGIPYKIEYLNKKIKIKEVSCGHNFAMLLNLNGIVYSIGSNENDELGLGYLNAKESTKFICSPVQNIVLSNYYKERIISIKCGFKHTSCLSATSKIYAWGNNKYGQLGTGTYLTQNIPVQIKINMAVSTNNVYKEKIIQIQCGFRNTVYYTENRNIYFSGVLDNMNSSNIPIKFNIKSKSQEISDENKFLSVRILSTWSKNMSILYATYADIRSVINKSTKPSKIKKVIDLLSKNWNNETIFCPKIDSISCYFSSNFMK